MRKFIGLFAAALVMLAAAGCEKNQNFLSDSNMADDIITLSASIDTHATKTQLGDKDGDTYPLYWSEGDKIAVINSGKLFEFTLSEGKGTTNGTFICNNADGYDAAAEIQAFYPCNGVTLDNGEIKWNVPARQEFVEGSFCNESIPMTAYRANNGTGALNFANLFGVLKLQLVGAENEKLKSIEVFSDKAASGAAAITVNASQQAIALASTPNVEQKKVVLEKGSEEILLSNSAASPTEVLIALPAADHNFSVYIITDKGSYYKSVSSSKSIVAGKILKMDILNLPTFDNKMAYVENGSYYGEGITVDGKVWAPVNCGYEPADGEYKGFRYGKLYQWGRKYGQGGSFGYNEISDAIEAEYAKGPVELQVGEDITNANKCYSIDVFVTDWLTPHNDYLWNSGTEDNPIKTQYDPCPIGWRVPTHNELNNLTKNYSLEDKVFNNTLGLYYCGNSTYVDNMPNAVFLPYSGQICFWANEISFEERGNVNTYSEYGYYDAALGRYWTSSTGENNTVWTLYMGNDPEMYYNDFEASIWKGYGHSVRCIKD